MLGVLVSRADPASVHVGDHLLDLADWTPETDDSRPDAEGGGTVYRLSDVELREFEARHLDLERPADAFDDPDLLAIASKHAGETGRLLTAHHTGNFGPADHGGEDYAVARACPNAHAAVLSALDHHAPENYDVGMECTHHGPTDVGAPSMFVEVGSSEDEWADPDAARAVARAILDLRDVEADREPEDGGDEAGGDAADGGDETRRHLVGFGGGHYAPRFERVTRETDWAVGHVAPDWGLDAMGDPDSDEARQVLEAAFTESAAQYALVEGDRDDLRAAIRDLGYRPVSETWVRETDGVPLSLVRQVEDSVATVDNGLRFGDPAVGFEGSFESTVLPAELLDEARSIDRESTLAAITEDALAVVTDQGGTRPTERVVIPAEADRERLVEALADVVATAYDEVELTDDAVVARKETFDPDLAKTLGVPEGPKFGRLASGDTVEVDGEEVPPEVVTRETERRFSLK